MVRARAREKARARGTTSARAAAVADADARTRANARAVARLSASHRPLRSGPEEKTGCGILIQEWGEGSQRAMLLCERPCECQCC